MKTMKNLVLALSLIAANYAVAESLSTEINTEVDVVELKKIATQDCQEVCRDNSEEKATTQE